MKHPRTAIRYYAYETIKDAVKMGDRVYMSRPYPIYFMELPAIAIYFSGEQIDIMAGDRYIPQEYERRLNLTIELIDTQPTDPDKSLLVEDQLDLRARKIERAFYDDVFFQKRLSSYTGSIDDPGLIAGVRLLSCTPGDIDLNGEFVVAVQKLEVEISWADYGFVEKKMEAFDSYLMQINRVGWDEQTVDPVLIAAEGDL